MRWITFVFLFTLVMTVFAASDLTARPEKLQQLEMRIRELQAQMHNTRTEYGNLQQLLQNSEESIGHTAERLEALHGDLVDKQNVLLDLKNKKAASQKRLKNERRFLAQHIRAAYIIGRQDYFKLWLNQENPGMVGRVLAYYDYISRVRVLQISSIQQTLENLQILEQQIEQETSSLNQILASRDDSKRRLNLSVSEREKILTQLANTLENQDKELKRLQEDKRRLQTFLNGLGDTLRELPRPATGQQQIFRQLQGQLPYPVLGQVTHKFGERLVGKLKWQGLLISSQLGEKVRTVATGRVVFAQWFRHFGLLVIIDHNDGYMSLYAHNQSLYVKVGDWVNAGDVIASVGNSGGKNDTGLYFEIRYQGIPKNPLTWLKNNTPSEG